MKTVVEGFMYNIHAVLWYAIHGERLHLRPKDLSVKVDKAGDCAHEDPQGLRLRQRHPGGEVDVHVHDGDTKEVMIFTC